MLDTVRWQTAQGAIVAGPDEAPALLPGQLRIIDQTRLPGELVYLALDDVDEIAAAIRRLSVRGAPAIGCAAALGLAAAAQHLDASDPAAFRAAAARLADELAATRPTAVNLSWALDHCRAGLAEAGSVAELKLRLVREGLAILADDIRNCAALGAHGLPLIEDGMGVLTHCNPGALATGDFGTALAPLYAAHAAGRRFTVYADETRPLLQGSRLTAWELHRAGIDVVVLCDNMAAQVMREGRIARVLVGADRIAANGDTANKIGTYGLAVLARHHRIPFYVAAPASTLDPSLPHGDLIPIEQRDPAEVLQCGGGPTAPAGVRALNPAFDVTPHDLISGILTEQGLHPPPFHFGG